MESILKSSGLKDWVMSGRPDARAAASNSNSAVRFWIWRPRWRPHQRHLPRHLRGAGRAGSLHFCSTLSPRLPRSRCRDANVERVTAHLAAQAAGNRMVHGARFGWLPREMGAKWHVDAQGETWRAYASLKTRAAMKPRRLLSKRSSGACLRRLQQQLASLPPPRLHETIPDFTTRPNASSRWSRQSPRTLRPRRACQAGDRVRPHAPGNYRQPARRRIAGAHHHNDTKFNNVLLDDKTGESRLRHRSRHRDARFGALRFWRYGAHHHQPAAEDEKVLSLVTMQFPMFEALVRGYLETAGAFLTAAEREFLAFSGKLITFESGFVFSPITWAETRISKCIAMGTTWIAAARSSGWWNRSSSRKRK